MLPTKWDSYPKTFVLRSCFPFLEFGHSVVLSVLRSDCLVSRPPDDAYLGGSGSLVDLVLAHMYCM